MAAAWVLSALLACGGQRSEPARGSETCQVRHEGRCYADKARACEAAGCSLERCELSRTDPAQIQCAAEMHSDAPDNSQEPSEEPECHLSCCNEQTLELQRKAAAEMGDPSIEHECCMCE